MLTVALMLGAGILACKAIEPEPEESPKDGTVSRSTLTANVVSAVFTGWLS